MVKYVYPHLPSIVTTPFIRYSGSGLGNSLFVFARAIVFAEEHNLKMINPTWLNFDPVQWRLRSKDKRLYNNIFNSVGTIGVKRLYLLIFGKKVKEEDFTTDSNADWVEIFWMKGFNSIISKSELVKSYLTKCIKPKTLASVSSFDFNNKIAVHIRLGDFGSSSLPISYYKALIEQVHEKKPQYQFLIFSDGKNEELNDVLELSFTKRVFFGSSMSDIMAISSCKALIGSHSTFSDWGGYLGQIPSLLPKKPHYGSFLDDKNKEMIVKGNEVPELFYNHI